MDKKESELNLKKKISGQNVNEMDVYFQSYVVGCEFIFVIFFNSRNKICHKKEREVMMQWQNVKVCPGEVFIFVARPQMSYLANCHYFKKLTFPSACLMGWTPFEQC